MPNVPQYVIPTGQAPYDGGVIGYDQNKMLPKTRNKNSGHVRLKVLIEPYCPFSKAQKGQFQVILNSDTLQYFNNDDRKKISAVNGLSGIFLSPQYNFRSNYLFDKDNNLLDPNSITVKCKYFNEQSWTVVPSPVSQLSVPTFRECSRNTTVSCTNSTVWGYKAISEDIGDQPEDECTANEIGNSNSGGVNNYVLALCSLSAAADNELGIHWKVEKRTCLYMGEDFFIKFTKGTLNPNIVKGNNVSIKPEGSWPGTNGDFLNVWYDGSINGVNPQDPPPINNAVLNYNTKINYLNGEIQTIDYSIDETSRKYYDFTSQAYYIVELGVGNNGGGGSGGGNENNTCNGPNEGGDDPPNSIDSYINSKKYFIIICQNAKPLFVRVEGGVSYVLSSYDGTTGKNLIDKSDFIMTVRSHLGKIVITFSDFLDKPWIIEDVVLTEQDYPFMSIPARKIAIWGGNMQSSFLFGPLQYNENHILHLPPGVQNNNNAYELPAVSFGNTSNVRYSFANGKAGPSPNIETQISQNGYDFARNQDGYIYTTDAQRVIHKPSSSSNSNLQELTSFLGIKPSNRFKFKTLQSGPSGIGYSKAEISYNYVGTSNCSSSGVGNAEPFKSIKFTLDLKLEAGNQEFNSILDVDSGGQTSDLTWTLYNCKTPIVPAIWVFSTINNESLWETETLDISSRVMDYSETWSSQDYFKIEHTAQMNIFMNKDGVNYSGSTSPLTDSQVRLLQSLKDRTFYVTVDVNYDNCEDGDGQPYMKLANIGNDTGGPFGSGKWIRLFTGLSQGGSLEVESGKRIFSCQLKDYTQILQDTIILNSPYFDGMRDRNAVFELLQICGFKNDPNSFSGNFPDPRALAYLSANSNDDPFVQLGPDNRYVIAQSYALPQSYDRITGAFYKFNDGDKVYDAIYKMAKAANKMFFFDSYGVFHYENRKFDNHIFNVNPQTSEAVKPDWYYSSDGSVGGLIFKKLSKKTVVEDVFSDIHLIANNPNNDLIICHSTSWRNVVGARTSSGGVVYNKQKGWLGYRKMFMQMEGLFGSLESAQNIVKFYSKWFNPPQTVKFESPGQPLRALDVVQLNYFDPDTGIGTTTSQSYVVTNVSSTISAAENNWWQTIEGEWTPDAQQVDSCFD
jgi:hypothetical protein